MASKHVFAEDELAGLAKQFRVQAKKTRPEAARELGVSHTSVFNAEEKPQQSLFKMRVRLIEAYSPFTVDGPKYLLKRKRRKARS